MATVIHKKFKCCQRCLSVFYCSRKCQKKDWKTHKTDCHLMDEMKAKQVGMDAKTKVDFPTDVHPCSICLEEEAKQPVRLQCGHSFCLACILRYRSVSTQQAPFSPPLPSLSSSCPICRRDTVKEMADDIIKSARLHIAKADADNATPDMKREECQKAIEQLEAFIGSVGTTDSGMAITTTDVLTCRSIKAIAYETMGEFDEALRLLDELSEEGEAGVQRKIECHALLDQCDRLEQAGRPEEADELFVRIKELSDMGIHQEQNLMVIKLHKAETLVAAGRYPEALEYLKPVFATDDFLSLTAAAQRATIMAISRCLYEKGNYEHSIMMGKSAIEMNRYFPGVHKYVVLSQLKSGDDEAAKQTMAEAVVYETPWDDAHRGKVLKEWKEMFGETKDAEIRTDINE